MYNTLYEYFGLSRVINYCLSMLIYYSVTFVPYNNEAYFGYFKVSYMHNKLVRACMCVCVCAGVRMRVLHIYVMNAYFVGSKI